MAPQKCSGLGELLHFLAGTHGCASVAPWIANGFHVVINRQVAVLSLGFRDLGFGVELWWQSIGDHTKPDFTIFRLFKEVIECPQSPNGPYRILIQCNRISIEHPIDTKQKNVAVCGPQWKSSNWGKLNKH